MPNEPGISEQEAGEWIGFQRQPDSTMPRQMLGAENSTAPKAQVGVPVRMPSVGNRIEMDMFNQGESR
jgi:hypothetical protein